MPRWATALSALGALVAAASAWRVAPPVPHLPDAAVELAGKLAAMAEVEKSKGDAGAYNAWLFAAAAARVLPSDKRHLLRAIDAAQHIVPAVCFDYVDDAAIDLAAGKSPRARALPGGADTGSAGGSVPASTTGVTTAPSSSVDRADAWASAPKWLQNIRTQIREGLINGGLTENQLGEWREPRKMAKPSKLGKPTMVSPFATVVVRWELEPSAALAAPLAADAAAQYEKFVMSVPGGASLGSQRLNNDFFDFQVKQGGLFHKLKAFRKVEARFRAAAAEFLTRHGMDEGEARRRASTRRVDSWASVHGPGSRHTAHSHFASSVSGVFYARVPEGSGRIRFHDPRGDNKVIRDVYGRHVPERYAGSGGVKGEMPPLAPFIAPYVVDVREGMLVLFPSWLLHEVEGSNGIVEGAGHRISFAFNLAGDWHDTAALTVELEEGGARESGPPNDTTESAPEPGGSGGGGGRPDGEL